MCTTVKQEGVATK